MANILGAFFVAVWKVGIPVSITSFVLMWWSLKHEYFGAVSSLKELDLRIKEHGKNRKEEKKQEKKLKKTRKQDPEALKDFRANRKPVRKLNLVHSKWLSFGGGFYGVVALWTYILIELAEIRDFIYDLGGFFAMLSNISFDLLIRLLIDSFMNFIMAIAWPWYWMSEVESRNAWVLFLVAYLAYRIGFRMALHVYSKQKSDSES